MGTQPEDLSYKSAKLPSATWGEWRYWGGWLSLLLCQGGLSPLRGAVPTSREGNPSSGACKVYQSPDGFLGGLHLGEGLENSWGLFEGP